LKSLPPPVARLAGVHRHVQVANDVDHEAQRARLVLAARRRIAQHCGEPGERGRGIAFGRMRELVGVLPRRQRHVVPGRGLLPPERIGIGALVVGPGRRLRQPLAAENLLDMRARPAADVALGQLGAYPVPDRPPRRCRRRRDGQGRGQGKGDWAGHARLLDDFGALP